MVLSNPFIKNIINKVYRRRQNCLIAIAGAVGTGKSWLSLKMAESLDPAFRVKTREQAKKILKERIIRKPLEFTKLLNENKLKTGSVVIIDEAGTSLSNRTWQSLNNRIINFILQTFRYKHLIVFFTLPNLTFLDIQARRLLNFYIETTGIDFVNRKTYTSIKRFQTNPRTGDIYRKRLKYPISSDNPRIITFDPFLWSRPSPILRNEYELFAKKFKKELVMELENVLKLSKEKEEKKNRPPPDLKAIADKIIKDYPDKRITAPFIKTLYPDISENQARIVRNYANDIQIRGG